jgi:phosphatidylserine/phosphatidylglycerophosphate/cardiolipin synthase-like enzyme
MTSSRRKPPLQRGSIFLFVLLLALLACQPINQTIIPPTLTPSARTGRPPTKTPLPPSATPQPNIPPRLAIYFTDPTAPNAKDYKGGPDEALVAAIDAAQLSVDMAAYSLNLWSIRDALLRAERRGVVIRIVMESDNMDNREVQELIDAGIPILSDRHEGLMHDKFVLIDREQVWTGSMNYTAGGTYKDNNNLVRIRSSQVAEDYEVKFDEMFVHDRFGRNSLAEIPWPEVKVGTLRLQVYFSPRDGVAARIIPLIQDARESIYFMAFSFTSDDIGNAIRERFAAGVTVSGVVDEGQVASNEGTEYDYFLQDGLDVLLDGNKGLMHHKVIIIDHSIVITGSYNFTNSAEEQNDENVVIIFDPQVAESYLQEFQRVYDQAQNK